MTVLIADTLAPSCAEALEAHGHTVVSQPKLSGEALTEALREVQPHALIVRSTRVTAEAMAASGDLELIVRAGAGYDTIDVAGASAQGRFVANCPGKNAVAVAELTLGLLLSLDRRLADNVTDARAKRWNKAAFSKAEGVQGKTLGLIGLGNIGQAVARRAQAFGLRVIAWSRSLTEEDAAAQGVERFEDPLQVAAEADIVSLHVAATPETRHLADRAFFEAMKPGALFLNTTRASVVDEDALRSALDHKGLRAGLDVVSDEPSTKQGPFEHPLAQHPGVYLTHHIGASTQQAQDAVAAEAVRVVLTYAETGRVPNCVNLARQSPATHLLTVRHQDQVGVLAGVLDQVRQAEWNVQEMENLIFEGHQAACARIRFHGAASPEVLARIAGCQGVLGATVIPL
ncbi:MAG: NAD(P)-dependent oxidoreductase [Bacteroidota bacterium]